MIILLGARRGNPPMHVIVSIFEWFLGPFKMYAKTILALAESIFYHPLFSKLAPHELDHPLISPPMN